MNDEMKKRAAGIEQAGKPHEKAGRSKRQALDDLPRAAQDLDRENAAIHRGGVGGQKPGVKPMRETHQKRAATDQT